MKRVLTLLIFGSVCFAAGVAYDAHAQRKAREIIESFNHQPTVQQSLRPLPARILRP